MKFLDTYPIQFAPCLSLILIHLVVSEYTTDSDAYLSDRQGRSVTPIIMPFSELRTTQGNTAHNKLTLLTSDLERDQQSIRPQGLPADMSKEEREAAAELKKLEDQKRHQGITMGQEGSKLANAKRRRGFLDDEDFEDVIDADEDHEWPITTK